MAISKVIFQSPSGGSVTLMDVTGATATANDILLSKTAMLANGVVTTGTCTGIQLPVPSSGTNSFWVAVPNGTTTPNPLNEGDWIKLVFTVDSSGNSDISTPSNEST